MKNSLDEECFKILEYDNYRKLKDELKALEGDIRIFTNSVIKDIDKIFE